jgi:glycosyltransferase involved in cell wall biosynthesis
MPRQIVVCLTADGFEVNGEQLRRAGVKVFCLGMRRGLPSPAAFVRLIRRLRSERPGVLMTWLYHADLLGTLAARFAGVRCVVWNIRCSDMDFRFYSRTTRWTTSLLAKLSAMPWAVATNSHAGRRAHEQLGYAPRRWVYLPNGLDLERWHPDQVARREVRESLGLEAGAVGIVMVARLDPMKDHENLLAAAREVIARHPQARFFLIGRGTEALELPCEIKTATVALGERADIARLLNAFDIAVLSSRSEGFPNVIVEAMATSLPHVVTDVGDAAQIVGDTGIVVPKRDPAALADGICRLILEGEGARRERGRAARERVLANWSIDSAVAAYHALWRQAAGNETC